MKTLKGLPFIIFAKVTESHFVEREDCSKIIDIIPKDEIVILLDKDVLNYIPDITKEDKEILFLKLKEDRDINRYYFTKDRRIIKLPFTKTELIATIPDINSFEEVAQICGITVEQVKDELR